ncbi:hypothetical protein IE53DRAFT_95265 [Violaceomyces palustris]|uniref:Uncharacterized protein n=1 Tax=Violaceomyces palustris TaxID=1673888 RepID=A0ACD0NXE6_9BASI|nr:hypothetical protein IE53DRAFT_95265 [Violaceomyces palustris]
MLNASLAVWCPFDVWIAFCLVDAFVGLMCSTAFDEILRCLFLFLFLVLLLNRFLPALYFLPLLRANKTWAIGQTVDKWDLLEDPFRTTCSEVKHEILDFPKFGNREGSRQMSLFPFQDSKLPLRSFSLVCLSPVELRTGVERGKGFSLLRSFRWLWWKV